MRFSSNSNKTTRSKPVYAPPPSHPTRPQQESMASIRFFVPDDLDGNVKSLKELHEVGMARSGLTGTAELIGSLSDVQVLNPRGRHELDFFTKNFKLRGKSADFKILYTNIKMLFCVPRADRTHKYLVVGFWG
jgi:structure-specific recognition protein 1